MKFDLSIFQVWEKFGKKKAEYELIFVSRLLPVFRFLIIKNYEFNENRCILREVRFHGSCLVIVKYD